MITIGNDAEFILLRDIFPVSAIGLIGGNKHNPFPVKLGALQEDNVLAEINIDPAKTVQEWEHNINIVIKQLKFLLPKNYHISSLSSAIYPEYELQHRLYSEINLAELELNLSQSRRAELDPIERKMALSIYLKVASQVRPDSNIYENSLSRIDDLPEHKSHLRVA